MTWKGWTSLFAAVAALTGCASGPPLRVVRVNDVGTLAALTEGQALIIEFQPGDTLPLDVSIAGPLLESAPDTPAIVLTAKRRFFLRLDEDGLASSLDGEDFSQRSETPGSFQIGIGATRERGARGTIKIVGPTLREPE